MQKTITSILLLCSAFLMVTAQVDPGEITGQVINEETGEPLWYANVMIESLGVGATTNENGFYTIKPLDPGTYDVQVSYMGLETLKMEDLQIGPGQIHNIDFKLGPKVLDIITVIPPPDDLIDFTEASPTTHITGGSIRNTPMRNPSTIVAATTPGVYQSDVDAPLSFRGSRADATLYFVDGVKMRTSPNIPNSGIGYMSVYSGHIPAKYGDATGGIVVITTRSYFDR